MSGAEGASHVRGGVAGVCGRRAACKPRGVEREPRTGQVNRRREIRPLASRQDRGWENSCVCVVAGDEFGRHESSPWGLLLLCAARDGESVVPSSRHPCLQPSLTVDRCMVARMHSVWKAAIGGNGGLHPRAFSADHHRCCGLPWAHRQTGSETLCTWDRMDASLGASF